MENGAPSELTGVLRIGELSRRTGVSDHLLRSWESRYGLLEPTRSPGGFRLYSPRDEQRVRSMKRLIDEGLSPAQAARIALSPQAQEQWTQSMSQLMSATTPTTPTAAWPPLPTGTGISGPGSTGTGSTGPGSTGSPLNTFAALLAGAEPPINQPANSPPTPTPLHLAEGSELVLEALSEFDDRRAHAEFDALLADFAVESVLREVVLPMMQLVGHRWSIRDLTVAQEHFTSSWVRGRLNALARGWATASGPVAVVASPSGELHDLAGMVFGIVLHRHGWRVIHLGANTPVWAMDLNLQPRPDVVVCSALTPTPFDSAREELRELAQRVGRVCLAGSGANPELAAMTGCTYLSDDPVTAAGKVARGEF